MKSEPTKNKYSQSVAIYSILTRQFIRLLTVISIFLFFILLNHNKAFSQVTNPKKSTIMNILNDNVQKIQFPELPYAYDALEPHIDKMTMEIHYSKHHKAYFDNFMLALKDQPKAAELSLYELMKNIGSQAVSFRNNGGGFFNHHLFWNIMSPKPQNLPTGKLAEAINRDFGSFEAFKTQFETAAKTRFGSGWAWLSVDKTGKLFVSSTPNQDNPFMDITEKQGFPIIGLDVWEHAYYLKFQNRRPDYVATFWNVLDWKIVEELFAEGLQFKF